DGLVGQRDPARKPGPVCQESQSAASNRLALRDRSPIQSQEGEDDTGHGRHDDEGDQVLRLKQARDVAFAVVVLPVPRPAPRASPSAGRPAPPPTSVRAPLLFTPVLQGNTGGCKETLRDNV